MKCFLHALVLLVLACTLPAAESLPAANSAPAESVAHVVVNDPHSYARPAEIRVEHLTLDLEVSFARKQLIGTATLRVKRVQPNATQLILDTAGLTISKVTLLPGGRPADYRLGGADAVLGQKLEVTLTPDTTDVAVQYATHPEAGALQWLAPAMTAGKTHPFLLSQSQAILARSWVPLQDTPQVRFTYDATIRAPKELLALMSAENPQKKSADGLYHFRMDQPIPSYLLALAVGDLEFRAFDQRSGVYAEPRVVAAAAREFEDTPAMMKAAESLYGTYQWGRYDLLVLPPSFPYGGMENPRLTFLTPTLIAGDKSLVDVVAHELAHSWSGNLVTNATWNDFWLNEGFTTYFQHRITEQIHGRAFSEMLWSLEYNEVKEELATLPSADQSLYLELGRRNPDVAPGTVYGKGALLLRLLEETAGRDRWDQFLRTYFSQHAFESMTTTSFLEILNAQVPDLANRVSIEAWIKGPGLPANCPVPQSDAFTRVAQTAEQWVKSGDVAAIDDSKWSSQERVHFIQSLPRITPEQMAQLDERLHFKDSGNSEVLFAWLQKAAQERYVAAYPVIEHFLTMQGRRKFLRPIYTTLAKHPEDLEFARRIYEGARPTYHPVSQAAIDAILL